MKNLLDFLTRHYHWFLFALLEVTSFVLLFQANAYQGSVWFSSANTVVGEVYKVNSEVKHFFSLPQVNRELTLRNFYLERQVNSLQNALNYYSGDTAGVKQIAHADIDRYTLKPAKVVSNMLVSDNNLITIDRGTADGLHPDMGVISGNGVVGIVYQSSEHFSIVLPVLNRRSNISCKIRGRNYFGYLKWDGGATNKAWLDDIPRHAHFKLGDWVVTSGYSSVFPEGVLVGKILHVYNSDDGLSYRLQIHLSTDFGNLRDVLILDEPSLAERATLLRAAQDSLNVK